MNKTKIAKVSAVALSGLVLLGGGLAVGANSVDVPVIPEMEECDFSSYEQAIIDYDNEIAALNKTIELKSGMIDDLQIDLQEQVTEGKELDKVFDYFVEVPDEVSLLVDDLDDDEAYLIKERVEWIKMAKDLAVEEVYKEFADEADGYEIKSLTAQFVELDEDDIEKIDVEADYEDVEWVRGDIDDFEGVFKVKLEFEHDDVDYEAEVEVEIEGDSVEDFDIVSIVEE